MVFFVFKGYRILLYMSIAGGVSWLLARQGVVAFTPALAGGPLQPFVMFALNSVFGFGFGIGMLVAFLHARTPKHWWQVLKQRWLTPLPLLFAAGPVVLKVGMYSAAEFWLLSVVFVFVVAENDVFGLLSSKGAFLLGKVSYSFYITHGIVLFVLTHLVDRWVRIRTLSPLQYWVLMSAAGVAAVSFATLLYWSVEQRFMKRSQHEVGSAPPAVHRYETTAGASPG